MPTEGEHRVARNEAAFRGINESIEAGRRTRTGRVGFLCECGALGCNDVIELTLEEYEAVRGDSRRFVIVPGHETEHDVPLAEASGDRYTVVVKRGAGAALAAETDPRAAGDRP